MAGVVLVVDDDDGNRDAVAEVLSEAGFVACIADSGPVALEMLCCVPHVCLVLLDVHMPVCDGWETLGAIWGDRRFSEQEVCLITAGDMPPPGLYQVLLKPFDVDALVELVQAICRRCGCGG